MEKERKQGSGWLGAAAVSEVQRVNYSVAVVTAEGKRTTHELLAVIKIYSLQVSWLEMSFPNVYITGFRDEAFRRYWGLGGVMGPHDGKVTSTRQRNLSQCTCPVSQRDTICCFRNAGRPSPATWVFPVSGSMSLLVPGVWLFYEHKAN